MIHRRVKMEVLDVIKKRRSVRGYMEKPIGEDVMRQLIEAAIWAPSGHRMYAWKIAIVEKKEIIERIKTVLRECMTFPPRCCSSAVTGKKESRETETWEFKSEAQKKAYDEVMARYISIKELVGLLTVMDISMAVQNTCLAGTSLDIGSCIVSLFNPDRVRDIASLPETIIPLLIVSLGYPRKIPEAPPRRSVEEMVINWIK